MDKDSLAIALQRGGVKPAHRIKIGNNEILIADGFVDPPHHHLGRFGVSQDEYPHGVFMTIWWTDHTKGGRGGALFFEPDHDPLMMQSFKGQARINAAIRAAQSDIERMDKNAKH